MDELRDARSAALGGAHSDAIMRYLKLLRAQHVSVNPLEVYKLSKVMLGQRAHHLSESEKWSIREDHAIACIQLGKSKEALDIVNIVAERFPRSCRAARLKGMYLESVGKLDEALKVYDEALQVDPDNLMMIHRRAALKKGRGDIDGALCDLHKHLDTQLGDYQTWYEAGKLHARQGAYAKAIFCFEEVLMHQPGDFQTRLILADCLYASGGDTNIRLARKYYASVVEMSGGSNVKALMGLCQCVCRLGDQDVKHGASDESVRGSVSETLGNLAAEKLMSEYAVKGSVWLGAMSTIINGP